MFALNKIQVWTACSAAAASTTAARSLRWCVTANKKQD